MGEEKSELTKGNRARSNVLPHYLIEYGVALLSVGLALGITLLLTPYLASTPTPLFFIAVMISAWYGGLGPGILATILSTLAINYFFLEPLYQLSIPDVGTLVRVVTFVVAAFVINSLNGAQRAARRRAEANFQFLRQSEARFGGLAQSNIIGMIVAELDGDILDANQNFLELVGYTEEDLRAGRLHWREMTPPESMAVSERAVQELINTGVCTPFEKKYIHKDGSHVPVLHGAVMSGKNTVTGFVLDLSEHKRIEAMQHAAMYRERSLHAEVQAANQQLETVLASLNDQFLVLDRQWRYLYVSDRVVEVVNRPRAELLGKCIWEVFPETVGSQFYQEVHRAVAEQKIAQFEYFFDPWQRWFENRVYPSAAGVSILVIDITERKQSEAALQTSEERYRSLVATTTAVVWTTDATGGFISPQPSWEAYTGQTWDEYAGWKWLEMFHPDDREALAARWNQALAGRSFYEVEGRLWHAPSQQHRYVVARAVPLLDADGSVREWIGMDTDIHDQKQAQIELNEQRQLLEIILKHTADAIMVCDANGKLTFVNPEARRLAQQDPNDTTLDLDVLYWGTAYDLDGNLIPLENYAISKALRGEISNAVESRMVRADDSYYDILVGAAPLRRNGQIIGAVANFVDISDLKRVENERKQVQQELQQTLQTLSTLIQASPLPIIVIEPDLTVKLWNSAAEQVFGWSEAEVIGQPLPIVPEDKQEECYRLRDAVIHGEIFFGVETYRSKRDGSQVILSASAAPLYDDHGNANAILFILQDITERQHAEANLRDSEERLRLALAASNQGLYDLNVQTGEGLVSPAYAEMLGYDPANFQETNAKWRERLHPDDVDVTYQAYQDYVSGKLDTYRVEFRQRTRSGAWKWILSIGKIVAWDDAGQPLRMIGTHLDIDDRKQAEAEREQLLAREKTAREEAETANRIKDEFLAVLSHELRSPLNPILGWAKLLQTQKLDEEKTKQALATIERNAKLQTQLIEDLLDVSRILRGKLVLNIAPVSLINTIEAALETVRLAIEAKGIQVERVFTLELDQVMGDAARLQQVVWNLLTNAVKFTPPNGVVEIRLEQFQNCAQIQVRDTGKGISPEFLPYVFDYFRQEDGTTTRKFGGLGLGLAIVRHITELHGGTVRAESPGENLGATFTVRLPLMPVSVSVDEKDASPTTANLTGLRILAVDDDEDIRELTEFILQQAGAEVLVVASATEALQQLQTFSPELLISDIGMPDFDGYMFMRQVQSLELEQKIPAIALTAYAGEFDQQQAIAAGFQMHLAKPIEPEKLISAIVALCKKK